MRIGLFGTWISESHGGIENLCYNMFKSLQAKHDVQAFSLNVPEEDKFSQDVFYAKTNKRTVPVLSFLRAYMAQKKRKAFDVNIAIHWGPGLCALAVKKLFGTPYLVYVHGKEVDYFKTPVHKFIVAMVLNNAKYIMGNSNYTLNLCQWTKNKNYALVPPGVDDIMFTEPQEPLEYPADTVQLFGISRLVRRKGFQYAIEAVQLLRQQGVDVCFKLAGGGEMLEELKALTQKLGLQDNIEFLGRITLEEKIRRMNACDLFVMPSYEIVEEREIEGFGIVYIEANAAGRFVIAGKDGGVPDAVNEGVSGYMVDGKKPTEIAAAIMQYMEKPAQEKAALQKSCREWAQGFKWDKIVERIEPLL